MQYFIKLCAVCNFLCCFNTPVGWTWPSCHIPHPQIPIPIVVTVALTVTVTVTITVTVAVPGSKIHPTHLQFISIKWKPNRVVRERGN